MPTIQVHNKREHAIDSHTRLGIVGVHNFTFGAWTDVKVGWAKDLHGEVISIVVTNLPTRVKTYRYIHKSFCNDDLKNRYGAIHRNMNGW